MARLRTISLLLFALFSASCWGQIQAGIVGASSAAATPSTPDTIFTGGTLKRWYRGDATVCGGGACSNGNNIETFTDKAGNGDATFSSTKSTYLASAVNGQPGINSGGAYYTVGGTGFGTGATSQSYFAVVRVTDLSGYNAIISGAAGAPEWRVNKDVGSDKKQEVDKSGVALVGESTSVFETTSYHKIAFTFNGSTGAWVFYFDSDSADNSGTTATTFTADIGTLLQTAGGALNFNGVIADLVIVSGVATGTQVTQMMGATGYFKTRYGL